MFTFTSCNRNRKIDRTNTVEQKHDQVLKWRVEHHGFEPLILAERASLILYQFRFLSCS